MTGTPEISSAPTPAGAGSGSGTGAGSHAVEPRGDRAGDPGGLVRRPLALSASRAADFRQCPLLYRLRAIDRLPEPRTRAQVVGTVTHSVLERLYGLEQAQRTTERAAELVPPEVERFYTEDSGAEVVPVSGKEDFASEVAGLVSALYRVEDPTRFSPEACEQYLVTATGSGTPLHGYLDRVDVAPTGEVRVVDYKTGKPPRPGYEDKVMAQMRFYALMYHRIHGVAPTQLKLIYLKNGSALTHTPDEAGLAGAESTLDALWSAIERAGETGDFRPRTSRLCDWCQHRALCPEFGGTPPEYPGWPGSRAA